MYNTADRPIEIVDARRAESIVLGVGDSVEADESLLASAQVALMLESGTLYHHQVAPESPLAAALGAEPGGDVLEPKTSAGLKP